MNALDIFILICLAGGVVHGFTTGVLRQVSSVVSMLFGFLIALQLMRPVGEMLTNVMGLTDQYAPVIGFVVVFLVFHLAVILLVKFFETVLEVLKLTTLNRVLGSIAGAFKAVLLLGILFLALAYVKVPDERTQSGSMFYGPISGAVPATWNAVRSVFPQVEELSRKFGSEVRKQVDDSSILGSEGAGNGLEAAAEEVGGISGD